MKRHRFEEITAELQAAILRGEIPAGSLLPAEREMQRTYGVSRTTIRRAITDLVAAEWAESSPNRGVIARMGPQISKSHRVAYVDHRDSVHKSLFFKLHTRLAESHFELVHYDSQEVGTLNALQRAADEGCCAAYVWPKVAFLAADALDAIRPMMAVIAVDHSLSPAPADVVMSDHLEGARIAVSHLIRQGRRRIAISGNMTTLEDAQSRFQGFMLAQYEHGILPEAINFVFSSPQVEPNEDPRLLRYRLTEEDRPDAVFVLHDMSVPAIVETVLASGLRIPDDVAIVGFGNDLPFSVDGVGLTTIGMNWDLVADALVERMKHRMSFPTAPFLRSLIPTKLIIRGSCGEPRPEWSSEPYEVSSVTLTSRMQPWHMVHPNALQPNAHESGNAMASTLASRSGIKEHQSTQE